MIKRIVFSIFLIHISIPAFSQSLSLLPADQATDTACTIELHAEGLVSVRGFDIVITWSEDAVECTALQFQEASLTGFSVFKQEIDNSTGRMEIVLLRLDRGGFSGDADAFVELRFEAVSPGTTMVEMSNTLINGDPVLIDTENAAVEAERNSARVIIVDDEPPPIAATRLYQNFPNPFNPGTTITFDISSRTAVDLKVFDTGGRLVRTLISGETYGIGAWEIDWDGRNDEGRDVPSGIYFCVLEAAGVTDSRKLVIIR
jgi:hypothetical protein